MSQCGKCGNVIQPEDRFCMKCGTRVNDAAPVSYPQRQPNGYTPTTHEVPKCNSCGYIGPWKVDPLFGAKEIIITIILLCFGIVPGIIYIIVHCIIFGSSSKRGKSCVRCKARNMFTFLY